MEFDEPLDFESEDLILRNSLPTKKRRKIIGLDDLLTDHYKEKSKLIEKESKKAAVSTRYNSDDDDEDISRQSKEAHLSQIVDECEKQVQEIKSEDKIPLWDVRVFGNQKVLPSFDCSQIGSCKLLTSFMNNELNAVLGLRAETGEAFLEGMLINGWLLKSVFASGYVEKSVAIWTFNLMLYSTKEDLSTSACDFWCSILQSKNEVDQQLFSVDWLPNFTEVKRSLVIYGFLFDPSNDTSSLSYDDGNSEGPPQNIRCWVRFVAACCQVRNTRSVFSHLEAEELLGVIIYFFLDRQLQGLSLPLYECMTSVISFFTDDEWIISCQKVAKHLASRVEKDLNCIRLVECISGVDTRSKHLRSEVAFHILMNCFDKKVSDGEGVLKMLMGISLKVKSCDFFMIYIYLVLGENWLMIYPQFEDKPFIHEMWGVFLQTCSCQISPNDLRSYASKVRYKATYLCQRAFQRNNCN